MAVTIDGIRLWQAQQDQTESRGDVDVKAFPNDDSDQALLVGLEALERLQYNGIATGLRLATNASYSSDPKTALAEWVAKIEALVDGKQGEGYTLVDDERSDNINVVIESFGWQREEGAALEVQWDMSVIWARGMMVSQDTTPDSVSPSQSWSLDGISLPPISSYRQTKDMQLEPVALPLSNPGEDDVKHQSGAQRRILINGQVTDTEGLTTFDDQMQNRVGKDRIVTFSSGFPGRSKDVMINNYEGTREAGVTRMGEYVLELIEGTA